MDNSFCARISRQRIRLLTGFTDNGVDAQLGNDKGSSKVELNLFTFEESVDNEVGVTDASYLDVSGSCSFSFVRCLRKFYFSFLSYLKIKTVVVGPFVKDGAVFTAVNEDG